MRSISINYEGFLSDEIIEVEKRIYENNKAYFNLIERYNRFSHKLKFKINIHRHNMQEITVSGLFILILNSINSIYFLVKKGLINDAKILTRTIAEKTIKMKYCSLNYKNSIQYFYQSELRRLTLLYAIKDNRIKGFSDELINSINLEMIDEVKSNIEKNNIAKLPSTEDLAAITGLPDLYSYTFRLFSDDVHANPQILDNFFQTDKNNEITQINWYPNLNRNAEIRIILITCVDIMDKCLNVIFELFDSDGKLKLNNIEYSKMRDMFIKCAQRNQISPTEN